MEQKEYYSHGSSTLELRYDKDETVCIWIIRKH